METKGDITSLKTLKQQVHSYPSEGMTTGTKGTELIIIEELINRIGQKTIPWTYKEEKKSRGFYKEVESLTDCVKEKEISWMPELKFMVMLVQSRNNTQHGGVHGS